MILTLYLMVRIYISDGQASSSSTSGFPDTVSFPLYEEMVRLLDRVQGENRTLRQQIDRLYGEDRGDERRRPTLISRLKEIARIAEDRLEMMVPHKERESQIVLRAIFDELHRVITHLRTPVSTASSSGQAQHQ